MISSMPLGALCQAMEPAVDTPTAEAAADLDYRDHLTVALVVNQAAFVPRQLDLRARPGR